MKPLIRFEHPLTEGHNFRRMAVAETGGVYRFQLIRDFVFIYSHDILPPDHNEVSFRDEHDREWVRMTRRTKTVREGYAWNGNSWKKGFRLFGKDFWVGTPDYHPGTLEGSLGHDPDYQFGHTAHFPFGFDAVNYHYFLLCQANRFNLAHAYYGALCDFGGAAWEAAAKNPVRSVLL